MREILAKMILVRLYKQLGLAKEQTEYKVTPHFTDAIVLPIVGEAIDLNDHRLIDFMADSLAMEFWKKLAVTKETCQFFAAKISVIDSCDWDSCRVKLSYVFIRKTIQSKHKRSILKRYHSRRAK